MMTEFSFVDYPQQFGKIICLLFLSMKLIWWMINTCFYLFRWRRELFRWSVPWHIMDIWSWMEETCLSGLSYSTVLFQTLTMYGNPQHFIVSLQTCSVDFNDLMILHIRIQYHIVLYISDKLYWCLYSEDRDPPTQRKWPMRTCGVCATTRFIFSLLQ